MLTLPIPFLTSLSSRLLNAALGAALFASTAAQSGCVRDDPAFRVTDMAAAPTLAGDWKGADKDGKPFTLEITEGVQAVGDGRLLARGEAAFDEALKKKETVPVYNFHAEFAGGEGSGRQADKDGNTSPPPSTMDVRGYLLSDPSAPAGQHYLCIQNEEKNTQGLGSLFTINTQWMLSLKLDGDHLTIRTPSVFLLLSPRTTLLDPPAISSPDAPSPTVEEALKKNGEGKAVGGSFFTTDADRALGVLRRYGSRPEFWQDHPMEFTRVK